MASNFDQLGVEAIVKGLDKYQSDLRKLAGETDKATGDVNRSATSGFGGALKAGLAFGTGLLGVQLGISTFRSVVTGTIGAAIDFESAMAGVAKTVDGTDEEIAAIGDAIRDMAKEIPISVTELAGIAEIAGQLGIAKEDIVDFTRIMAEMGVATNVTAAEAAEAMARIASITGLPIEQIDNLTSSIVNAGNNFAATEGEIIEFTLRIAAAGNQAGLTEADLVGFSAAMAAVGVNAEAGGTAFSKLLFEINTAVLDGGEKLTTFAAVAGQSASEFQQSWEEDAAGAVVTFLAGLDEFQKQGGNSIAVLEDLDLTDARLIRTVLSLAGAHEQTAEAVAIANEGFAENNARTAEAERRFETTASQIQIFKNRINDLGIEVGTALLPALNKMLDFLNELAEDVSPEVTAAIEEIKAVINDLRPVFEAMQPIVAASIALIMERFRGLAEMIGGVVTVIRGIVTGDFGQVMDGMVEIVRGATRTLLAPLTAIMDMFGVSFETIGKTVGGAMDAVIGAIQSAINWILSEALPTLTAGVDEVIKGLNKLPGVSIPLIGDSLRGLTVDLGSVGGAFEYVGGTLDRFLDTGTGLSSSNFGDILRGMGFDANYAGDQFGFAAEGADDLDRSFEGLGGGGGGGGSAGKAAKEIVGVATALEGFLEALAGMESQDELVSQFGEMGGELVAALLLAMEEGAEGPAGEAVVAIFQQFREFAIEELGPMGGALADSLLNNIALAMQGNPEALQNVLATIHAIFVEAAQETAAGIGEAFAAAAAEGAAHDVLVEGFGELGAAAIEALDAAMVEGAEEEAGPDLFAALDKMLKKADEEGLKHAPATGKKIIDLITRGLQENDPTLLAEARRLMEVFGAEILAASEEPPRTLVEAFIEGFENEVERQRLEEIVGEEGASLMLRLKEAIEENDDGAIEAIGRAAAAMIDALADGLAPGKAEGLMAALWAAITRVIEEGGADALAELEAVLAEINALGEAGAKSGGGGGAKPTPNQLDPFGSMGLPGLPGPITYGATGTTPETTFGRGLSDEVIWGIASDMADALAAGDMAAYKEIQDSAKATMNPADYAALGTAVGAYGGPPLAPQSNPLGQPGGQQNIPQTFSPVDVAALGMGGVITKPLLAALAEGGGTEAVLPLDGPGGQRLADFLASVFVPRIGDVQSDGGLSGKTPVTINLPGGRLTGMMDQDESEIRRIAGEELEDRFNRGAVLAGVR